MRELEYRVNNNEYQNRIGLSIRSGKNNVKWSECDEHVRCSSCGSIDIDTDLTGDLLTITCYECENWWQGDVNVVLNWTEKERAQVSLLDVESFERVPSKERSVDYSTI